MAQTIVIGRITADLEMKTSANGNPYVRFDLVENIGNKENSRPQYFQICAWSDDAKRIVKARVKKGSLTWVSGSLELETFTERDGITTDKRLKILLDSWGLFLPTSPKSVRALRSRPLRNHRRRPRHRKLTETENHCRYNIRRQRGTVSCFSKEENMDSSSFFAFTRKRGEPSMFISERASRTSKLFAVP